MNSQELPTKPSNFMHLLKQVFAPIIPYITVGTGLLVLHNAWVAIISYHLGMIVVLLLSRTEIAFGEFFKTSNFRISLVAMVLGLLGGILLFLLWPFLAIPADIGVYLENIGLTEISWPLFIAYYIFVNPWIEEYYWRKYLGSEKRGIIPNDCFFAGYHMLVLVGKIDLFWLAVCFLVLLAAAWFWRLTVKLSKGLFSAAISHFLADLTVILAIFIMAPGIG